MATSKEDILNIVGGSGSSRAGQSVQETTEEVKQDVQPEENEVQPEKKESQEPTPQEIQVDEPTSEPDTSQTEKSQEVTAVQDVAQEDPQESVKYKELQSQLEAIRTEKEELESLLNDSDPLKYFANENEYKKQQILKSNPDVDPGVLDTLFGADIQAMSPVDILVYDLMAKTGEKDLGEIREHILSKYDYDPDGGKIPFSLKADANDAKKALSRIMNQEVSSPKDVKSLLESRKQEAEARLQKTESTFRPMAEKMAEEMKDIADGKGEDAVSYQYDPEFKKQVPDIIMSVLKSNGATLDNAEQKLSEARDFVKEIYLIKNFEKIVKAQVDEAVAAKDDEWRTKVHNPKPTSSQQAPEVGRKSATAEEAKKIVGG